MMGSAVRFWRKAVHSDVKEVPPVESGVKG
jgi:hypothetical protein